jgi:hypothetical protein
MQRCRMSAQFVDGNPALLKQWSENNNPMGRLGRPDEMRGATVSGQFLLYMRSSLRQLFLCSDASSCTWPLCSPFEVTIGTDVTGIDLRVDGGMRVS